ncbi:MULTISPECIES: YeeE/YedE family protein [unclassified Methylophilus]|uniref:YeeE/YedE family protein n=1 Tax=unclassified Methylophilus TaxID=2630143 RepID=UPI0006F273A7|nr:MULTISPECIES: YeeE/YedE family protein [unclassified Methylophilus]KQT41162.1 YeeE/YedE family protein [Methylophilus sp. Leaf416]KQT58372.1 YeeE/YedE family protein [Methylophilus sp. Leaf459]
MTTFTPWQSLIGGLLIGFSTLSLIRWLGKVAGISSIVGQLWSSKPDDRGWRLAFVIGLLVSPLLYQLFSPLPAMQIEAGLPLLIVSGLLVGFGTRLGSGCTSGHGVCGLSRLSLRSLVATLTFMLVAIVVVWVTRHLLNS